MKTNLTGNIDLDRWVVRSKEIPFGNEPSSSDSGWRPGLAPLNISFEKQKKLKNKLYPFIHFLYADFVEDFSIPPVYHKKMNESPKKVQDLFLKFYHDGMTTVMLNLSIIAKSHDPQKEGFKYSSNECAMLPSEHIKDYPKPYQFLLESFWIKNGLYKAPYQITHQNKTLTISDFDHDWVDVIMAIWQNYCQIENYLILDNIKFMWILETLSNLSRDTLECPLIDLNDAEFNIKQEDLFSGPKTTAG